MRKYIIGQKTYFGKLKLSKQLASFVVVGAILASSSIAYALVEVTGGVGLAGNGLGQAALELLGRQSANVANESLGLEPDQSEEGADQLSFDQAGNLIDAGLDSSETIDPSGEPTADAVLEAGQSIVASPNRSNPLAARGLYVSAHDPAGATARAWASTRPQDAQMLRKISGQPIGVWLVRSLTNISGYVGNIADDAKAKNQTPVFVLYGMPAIRCDNYAQSSQEYLAWVDQIKQAIGSTSAIVIVEPDELPLEQCGGDIEQQRYSLVSSVVKRLQSGGAVKAYIDAGHGNWVSSATMSQRLKASGIEYAQGFSLNVSNYESNADNIRYGEELSKQVGGAKYVIDTSRNGLGADAGREWCNAPGRALGERPRAVSSGALDGYLWIKYPGESDLNCNGGPSEGQWWPEYAVGLASRANY